MLLKYNNVSWPLQRGQASFTRLPDLHQQSPRESAHGSAVCHGAPCVTHHATYIPSHVQEDFVLRPVSQDFKQQCRVHPRANKLQKHLPLRNFLVCLKPTSLLQHGLGLRNIYDTAACAGISFLERRNFRLSLSSHTVTTGEMGAGGVCGVQMSLCGHWQRPQSHCLPGAVL